jgi:hypothetical protein
MRLSLARVNPDSGSISTWALTRLATRDARLAKMRSSINMSVPFSHHRLSMQ